MVLPEHKARKFSCFPRPGDAGGAGGAFKGLAASGQPVAMVATVATVQIQETVLMAKTSAAPAAEPALADGTGDFCQPGNGRYRGGISLIGETRTTGGGYPTAEIFLCRQAVGPPPKPQPTTLQLAGWTVAAGPFPTMPER